MRTRWFALTAGAVLAGTTASAPAMADVDWSGPGYYIEDIANFFLGGFIAGPFSSESDCKTAFAALTKDEQDVSDCTYLASDPDKS